MVQVAGGTPDELALERCAEENRQAAEQAQQQRQRLLRHLIRKQPGSTGHRDVRLDDGGRQAVIQAGGGGLNPAQTTTGDDLVPGHRPLLGVPAKDVGPEDLLGDPLLPCIDNFGVGRGRRDLLQVVRFDGVANYDTHATCLPFRVLVAVSDFAGPLLRDGPTASTCAASGS